MALKTKLVNIRGRDIKVKQISFMGQLNLMKDNSNFNLIKCSMSEDDFNYINNIEPHSDDVNDLKNILESINEVNGWNKSSDEQDFQENGQKESSEKIVNGTQNSGVQNNLDGNPMI